MRVHAAAAAAVLAACGSVLGLEAPEFVDTEAGDAARRDDGAGRGDGGDEGAPAKDGEALPRCDPTKPFGAAKPITELNGPSADFWPRLSADEKVLVFGSTRDGDFSIY